jgi:hypothetical protein
LQSLERTHNPLFGYSAYTRLYILSTVVRRSLSLLDGIAGHLETSGASRDVDTVPKETARHEAELMERIVVMRRNHPIMLAATGLGISFHRTLLRIIADVIRLDRIRWARLNNQLMKTLSAVVISPAPV